MTDDKKFLSLCRQGTLEEVVAALNEGADPNAKDIECIPRRAVNLPM